MSGLLHLDSSARTASVSRELTGRFAVAWRGRYPSGGYRYRDLARSPVPAVTDAYVRLSHRIEDYAVHDVDLPHELLRTHQERREWAMTRPLLEELLDAEVLLIGVPMYNMTIPADLKAWIDRVTVPGMFTDAATGLTDRLRHLLVVVVAVRGGVPTVGVDFCETYLEAYFTKLGVDRGNLRFVSVGMTIALDVPRLERYRDKARQARATAQTELDAVIRDATR